MANLESAAMAALQTGVNPYESQGYLDWMSGIPEAQKQLPGAIRQQRQRQVTELEKGIPEQIRRAAQPLARRGLSGSGLQLEDIGQAALDRQIAIDRAKTLAEIDPINAQIALQNLARDRAVQRGGEERRRFEREEDVTEKQRAQDQLMKTALASAGVGLLGKDNPLSRAIFGGTGQEGLLQKAIGGISGLFGGGGDTSMVTPEMMQYGRYGDIVDEEEQGLLAPGQTMTPLPSPYGIGYDSSIVPDTATDQFNQQFLPTQEQMLAGEGGGMYGGTSPYRDITTYEGEQQFPYSFPGEIDTNFTEQPTVGEEDYITPPYQYPSPSEKPLGDMGMMTMGGTPQYDTSPSGGFEGFGGADDFAFEGTPVPGTETILEQLQRQQREASERSLANLVLNDASTDLDFDLEDIFDENILDTDYSQFYSEYGNNPLTGEPILGGISDIFQQSDNNNVPFGKTSGLSSTGRLEEMQKAMDQGFANAEITQKLLDEGKIGTEYASLLSDAGNYLPESGTDLLSTAGDIAKLPFQALDAGMKAVGSAKRTVGDLTTKALDTATGGAYSGIRGLGGQAAKAVSDALGGVVSPSTVGSAALTALRGKEGLKSIAKDPMGFAGKKLLSSALPSFESTVSALAKGSLPSLPGASLGAKALASNIAYDAALAKGLGVAAADKVALSAYSTGANPLLAAAPIAIPMILSSIGSMERKKSRAKAEVEEKRNLYGSSPFNFVPGGLWMAGNQRRSPALDEASGHFTVTDQLTGLDKIYLEDPRRSVMGGDSLSKRGQDFAKEAGIDYKHSDPDVQNTSQKWLGKQQFYSELIPDLKPIFMAGLKGEMSREQTEDAVSFYTNKFFEENPAIRQINGINNRIKDIEHQEADEIWSVQDKIMALKEQANQLYQKVPLAWRNVSGLMPQELKVEFIEDEQE
jgi:hypothetical protein